MPTIKKQALPQNFGRMMALLTERKLQGRRHDYVYRASGGRTESSKELSYQEVDKIIKELEAHNSEAVKADTMRKKIISMAREMGYEYYNEGKQKTVADMKRIGDWCIKFGYLHKPINDYTYAELPALVTQFEAVYTSFIRSMK